MTNWVEHNLSGTPSLGDRWLATTQAGVTTWTLPAGGDLSSDPNDIWLWNGDAVGGDSLTLRPPQNGGFFLNGTPLGRNTAYQLKAGELAICVNAGSGWYFVKVS